MKNSFKKENKMISNVNEAILKEVFNNNSDWSAEDDNLIHYMDEFSFIRVCVEFQVLNKYSDLEVKSLINITFKETMKVMFDTFLIDERFKLSQEVIKKDVAEKLLKKGINLKL